MDRIVHAGSDLAAITVRLEILTTLGFWRLVIKVISRAIYPRHHSKKYHCTNDAVNAKYSIHYTMPAKPLKAKAIKAATTNATGLPFQEGRVSALSSLSLKQEKR